MTPFAALSSRGQGQRLRRAAEGALPAFGLPPGPLRLVGVSENTVFERRGPSGRFAVRVHRTGYHGAEGVASELAWMTALADRLGDRVPRPVRTRGGAPLVTLSGEGLDAPRRLSVLPWLPGRAQGHRTGLGWARAVGTLTAQLQAHARAWTPPAGFTRPQWDAAALLDGAVATWRPPASLPGLTGAERRAVAQLRAQLRDTLSGWGRGPDDVGLIHADLHGHNVLIQGGVARAIDFDDAGYGWWWADLAVSVRPTAAQPDVAPRVRAWARAYRQVAPLPPHGVERLPALWATRRLTVAGWLAADAQAHILARHAPRVVADLRWLLAAWGSGALHAQAARGLAGSSPP